MLRVGTDCSGLEAPLIALDQLGVKYEHIFSSEVNASARRVITKLFRPNIMYSDMTTRDNSIAPEVDLYVCGFPCQTFSLLGKKGGMKRSPIFYYVRDYIREKRPKVFVLENVKNLLHFNGGKTFDMIISTLRESPYDVAFRMLDSQSFGVPQSRRRVYILGIRQDCLTTPLRSAEDAMDEVASTVLPRPKLSSFLDRVRENEKGDFHETCRQTPLNLTERLNLAKLKSDERVNLKDRTFAFDLGASYRFIGKRRDEICPCLNAVRCRYFVTNRNMRLSPLDCLRLQGIPMNTAVDIININSIPQSYKQAGNAMTVPVVGAVIKAGLSRTRIPK